MILGQLVVGESVVEDRQEDEVEAHSLLANEAAAEGQQGNEWSNSVHIHQQRHGRHAG